MRHRLHQAYLDLKHLTLGVPRLTVRSHDCFVTSWPRSGSTWLRCMLFHALFPEQDWDLVSIERRMPMVDRRDFRKALARLDAQPRRMFKSHDPFHPHYLEGKTVYVVRDGRDAILSFYHYREGMDARSLNWPIFLSQSLRGKHRYGSWQDHVLGWTRHGSAPSVLMVKYEDLLQDPVRELGRALAQFGLAVAPEQAAAAVERSAIDRVYQGFHRYAAQRGKQFDGGLGGGSGRWRQWFSDQDRALFNTYAGDAMRQLGYEA